MPCTLSCSRGDRTRTLPSVAPCAHMLSRNAVSGFGKLRTVALSPVAIVIAVYDDGLVALPLMISIATPMRAYLPSWCECVEVTGLAVAGEVVVVIHLREGFRLALLV